MNSSPLVSFFSLVIFLFFQVLTHTQTFGQALAKEKTPRHLIDPVLEQRIKELIETQAAFGIRSVWAWLRFVEGLQINRKKVERIMRLRRWTLMARRAGQRPRAQASRSIAEAPNQRCATDIALVHCGINGWCAMVSVIDGCTREILGWELDHTARAKTGERATEGALLNRFGWLHGAPPGLALRHDNGLVFGSRLYRSTIRPPQALDYLSPTQHLNSPNLPVNKPSHLSSYRRHTICRRNRVPESGHHFMKEMTCDDRA
ncbi:hypothetical protein DB345_21120 [Spartobacteria bacterium LR76]|nr:hypothetical protein DB345_21120 [Spartobacteria bacterium LR76]